LAQRVDDQLTLPELAVLRMTPEQVRQLRIASNARKRRIDEPGNGVVTADALVKRFSGQGRLSSEQSEYLQR
jgi:hypothetical protein